jgi:hypothetical protein
MIGMSASGVEDEEVEPRPRATASKSSTGLCRSKVLLMNALPSPEQVPDHGCPRWCEHEHLGLADDPCGFHHDGPVTAVDLMRGDDQDRGSYLFVNVSQLESQGGLEPPYVEVQDDQRTLALLTLGECMALARALLEGARSICEMDAGERAQLRPLITELEQTVGTLASD